MPQMVNMGSQIKCSFGVAPSVLGVIPAGMVNASQKPAATIMDNVPMVNIMPFGMCQSLANPQVAAATTAALGVLTPMPCIPVIPAPWTGGSVTVNLGGKPALLNSSTANCMWAGVITIIMSGAVTENAS